MATSVLSPPSEPSAARVHVYAKFNVDSAKLPRFYEAAGSLLGRARADEGCENFAFQRELPWSNNISNEASHLVVLRQEWSSAAALEAHVQSEHSRSFNEALGEQDLLAGPPGLTLFGPPLSLEDLSKIASQARAAGYSDPKAGAAVGGAAGPPPPMPRRSGATGPRSSSLGASNGAAAAAAANAERVRFGYAGGQSPAGGGATASSTSGYSTPTQGGAVPPPLPGGARRSSSKPAAWK